MSDCEPHDPRPEFLELEQRRNRESREAWNLFAEHRAIVTDHLARGGSDRQDKSLCLVGAGNANDVDLQLLATRFGRIDLVDWDTEALQLGLRRQGVAQDPRFTACGVDLGEGADDAHVNRLLCDRYDVVASLCLLTQLVDQLVRRLGASDDRLLERIQALRRRHVRWMIDRLRPGGMMLLVTDFVSSETCPELIEMDVAQIASAANGWLAAGNFFTGVNPRVLYEILTREAEFTARLAEVQLVRPWRWRLSERRAYAVCALKAISIASK